MTAHIDGIINTLSVTLERYQRDEPVRLGRRFTKTEEEVVLEGIRPLPQAAASCRPPVCGRSEPSAQLHRALAMVGSITSARSSAHR
jgi:hypothetical protein